MCNCSGECCICLCGDFCLAGNRDDYFSPATNEQILKRLAKGEYLDYRDTMIKELQSRGLAKDLYQMSYRKASDVAREIFEEIEEILDRHSISYLKVGQICGEHYYDGVMQFDIAELKKKYTEEPN